MMTIGVFSYLSLGAGQLYTPLIMALMQYNG